MQAIILNSGLGSRMKDETENKPKCMVKVKEDLTLIENQINILLKNNIKNIIVSTGYLEEVLIEFLNIKYPNLNIKYIKNDIYYKTNYIYSIYLLREYISEDVILMHGDLYFNDLVLKKILASKKSNVIIDKTLEIPEKDFKGLIKGKSVKQISVKNMEGEVFSLQPLYYLKYNDWIKWKLEIEKFIKLDNKKVYAEDALNNILDSIDLGYININGELCMEVDTKNDLNTLKKLI